MHIPVLLIECLKAFRGLDLKVFIDSTLGAGGHSEAILNAHPEVKHLIGIDQDKWALDIAKKRLKGPVTYVHGNFSELKEHLSALNILEVDGILADLGVSSMQLDTNERGFSFMREGPLDMRMDQSGLLTAADIVNTWEEMEIANLIFRYGEEKQARKIAKAVCKERQQRSFRTTLELATCIEKNIKRTRWDVHPATKAFQAIRIVVNGELDRLEHFLGQALQALKRGGRLAIITFHSLEDRIVKQRFVYEASDKESTSGIGGMFLPKNPTIKILTKKPIEATAEETSYNPRSRSAKLRVIEKL